MLNIKSYLFQFISIFFSFLNVKLFVDFLGDEYYPSWLVIFSLAGLIYTLDFGIGSGVRNQLARLVAKNASPKARANVVFTYYKFIIVLALGFWLAALAVGLFARTHGWLTMMQPRLIVVMTILVFIDFVARAHHPVFAGLQNPQITNISLAITQSLIFFSVYFFLIPNGAAIINKLWAIILIVFGVSIVVNFSMLLRLNSLVPLYVAAVPDTFLTFSPRLFEIYLKRGLPFFALQIEFLVLTQISLYFIYARFPNQLVVEMGIADKVFSPLLILATVIMYPFWSGYTLLMHRGEFSRIRRLLQRQELLLLVFFALLWLSLRFYDDLVSLWLNRPVHAPFFAFFAAAKVFAVFLNSIYSYFLNAIGKLAPQLYVYGIGLIVSVPLLYFFARDDNIYLSLCVAPLILMLSAVTQRRYIFNIVLSNKF